MEQLSRECKIYQGNCETMLSQIESVSIDAIITDPPYQYLDHELDTPYNEKLVFANMVRVLKEGAMLVLFGRGESFYRQCYRLHKLGMTFKEEIIWNKKQPSSPITPISRIHETISVWSKGKGKVNKVYIDKLENLEADNNTETIIRDIKRMVSRINGIKTLEEFKKFQKNLKMRPNNSISFDTTVRQKKMCPEAAGCVLQSYNRGIPMPSIIPCKREHYNMIHPTQKPLRLMKMITKLVSNIKDTILDPFGGVFSTGVAALQLNRKFIGIEILEEYYEKGKMRLQNTIDKKNGLTKEQE